MARQMLYECRRAYKGEPNQRQKSLTAEQIQELDALGMDWRTPAEQAWEEKYKAAAEMLEKMKQAENKTTQKRNTRRATACASG